MSKREDLITLLDEEGKEVDFELVVTLEVKDKEYAILSPVDEDTEDVYAFRIDQEENEDILVPIEDEEEFNLVSEAYESLSEE